MYFFKHYPNLSSLFSSAPQAKENSPIEQLAENAADDDAVVDADLETAAEQPVPTTEASENVGEQPGGAETGDGALDAGDVAGAGAVLDTMELPAAADQLPEMATAGQSPLAMVDDVMKVSGVTSLGLATIKR